MGQTCLLSHAQVTTSKMAGSIFNRVWKGDLGFACLILKHGQVYIWQMVEAFELGSYALCMCACRRKTRQERSLSKTTFCNYLRKSLPTKRDGTKMQTARLHNRHREKPGFASWRGTSWTNYTNSGRYPCQCPRAITILHRMGSGH